MTQTALSWFLEQLKQSGTDIKKAYAIACEMEKEQIIFAFNSSHFEWLSEPGNDTNEIKHNSSGTWFAANFKQ